MTHIIKCSICNKLKSHKAKGMCHSCYTHHGTPLVMCKKCGKLKNHWAKGYCSNCFLKKFHYDNVKAHNTRKYHNISLKLYKKVTESCILCGFDKIVELHHLNNNHKDRSSINLIGLCPNHHKMIHNELFSEEVKKELAEKLKERLIYNEEQESTNMNPNDYPQVKCKVCGKTKGHHAKCMCEQCYRKQHTPKITTCKRCGKERPHEAHGYCESCYTIWRRKGKPKQF
jgi:hypothetical protein